MTIVDDSRAVDPIAYIRAVGLAPEDSYGFLPLDVDDAASFIFLYRDRHEYARARAGLPAATPVGTVDLGVVAFGTGEGRMPDVEVAPQAPTGALAGLLGQIEALQQSYEGMPGMPDTSPEAQERRLAALRDQGVLSDAEYQQSLYGLQGGHAGPNPGGAPAAPADDDAPPIVAHRLFPKLGWFATGGLAASLPAYVQRLGLQSEDVYGVWPRGTRLGDSRNSTDRQAWDDYWILYRDRPEYGPGRAAWALEMGEGWPEPEIVPGARQKGQAPLSGGEIVVEEVGWPRKLMVKRKRDAELGEELRGLISYAPEDAYGISPDFNSNRIAFAYRSR